MATKKKASTKKAKVEETEATANADLKGLEKGKPEGEIAQRLAALPTATAFETRMLEQDIARRDRHEINPGPARLLLEEKLKKTPIDQKTRDLIREANAQGIDLIGGEGGLMGPVGPQSPQISKAFGVRRPGDPAPEGEGPTPEVRGLGEKVEPAKGKVAAKSAPKKGKKSPPARAASPEAVPSKPAPKPAKKK